MSFENETEGRRKTEQADQTQIDQAPAPKKKQRGHSPEVGHALRAAYQQTVSEDIPPEMLDLLGKLG